MFASDTYEHDNPEYHFWTWFDSLPAWQRQTLAKLYIVMTSTNNADFILSGKESLYRFEVDTRMPDFEIRRVARLLTIRSVFSFLLSDISYIQKFFTEHPADEHDAPVPLSVYQWKQIAEKWKRVCNASLSDSALHVWMGKITIL